MTKPISRLAHAFTDYPYVAAVTTAPKLLGFQDEPGAVLMTRVLTGTILATSVFTRAEWGFVRLIPYRAHLAIDTIGGLTALAAPWLMGFSGNAKARNAFLVVAAFGLTAGLASEPEEMP